MTADHHLPADALMTADHHLLEAGIRAAPIHAHLIGANVPTNVALDVVVATIEQEQRVASLMVAE
jgi:pyrimidine operon attenuation protein/uracil phosphoribosyltransferase